MLKRLQNDILLWVQAKTGLSTGLLISLAVAGGAILLMFVFLCVTGYAWLSVQLGPVFGGLAMAGVFLLMAVIGAAASALARHRTRRRAIVERAARAQVTRALIDPKALVLRCRRVARLAGSASFRWPCSAFWLRNGRRKPGAKIHPIGLFKRPSPCRALPEITTAGSGQSPPPP